MLKTIRLLTHDLAMILTETLYLDLEFQDKNETSVTQGFFKWYDLIPAKPRREQRPAPPFSVMACLVGCKTDTDETPINAYAKSY